MRNAPNARAMSCGRAVIAGVLVAA
ncbi:MAG: hypothetical protein QOJ89_2786, partial [bacterium]